MSQPPQCFAPKTPCGLYTQFMYHFTSIRQTNTPARFPFLASSKVAIPMLICQSDTALFSLLIITVKTTASAMAAVQCLHYLPSPQTQNFPDKRHPRQPSDLFDCQMLCLPMISANLPNHYSSLIRSQIKVKAGLEAKPTRH